MNLPPTSGNTILSAAEIHSAAESMVRRLLDRRNARGTWTGELSASALSTATAVMALHLAAEEIAAGSSTERSNDELARILTEDCQLIASGLNWLAETQNQDGGWGDTVLSISNISTTYLVYAVLVKTTATQSPNLPPASDAAAGQSDPSQRESQIARAKEFLERSGGVDAVIRRYGKDRTFSVPILTHCALAGVVDWRRVTPLPLELSCVPARFYAMLRLPVVSYALPALIAIGLVIFRKRGHWNPLIRWIRGLAIPRALRVLESIQPPHGGFLEATPLTSFVGMSLIGAGLRDHAVAQKCLSFLRSSVRADGSWPIDTNLATWVTTLSVNALADNSTRTHPLAEAERVSIRTWLLGQQYRTIHPYTNAAPGGWSWTDLPGGVPDADDTPGAMLALMKLRGDGDNFPEAESVALGYAARWLLDLQNRDGGWPTFCRGWGALPFDRSSNDLTAHAIRALRLWLDRDLCADAKIQSRAERAIRRGFAFLKTTQQADGSWLPLWFGNQFHQNDENPTYGTAKVLLAFPTSDCRSELRESRDRAVTWLRKAQNDDGSWSVGGNLPGSLEETGLAVEALATRGLAEYPEVRMAVDRGASWLARHVQAGTAEEPSPIGFYFAKLWYFESLYPTIFVTAGLQRWRQLTFDR